MATPKPVTAIFDIGKTNKKFLLFDREQSVVYQQEVTFDEIEDDEGHPCDDHRQLETWIKEEFRKVSDNRKFRITGLNFSTYGATLVHLDDNGKVVTPLYNYLKPYPDDLLQQFYNHYDGHEQVCVQTASPPLGMLNSGLQLYWLKHRKPGFYRKIKHTLHFPQYLAYLFHCRLSAEWTSIGCHTTLWDFQKAGYHRWVREEGIVDLLPDIKPVSTIHRITYNGMPIDTGIGIHDSSAALVPYLLATEEPFIHLSTGTWSIAMNPFTDRLPAYEELEKDVLLYMNIYGKPVRASRLFLGSEFGHQIRKLGKHFGRNADQIDCRPDPALFRKLATGNQPHRKLKFEKTCTSGLSFRNSEEHRDMSVFDTYEEACHKLMLDLVAFQVESLQLAGDNTLKNQCGNDIDSSGTDCSKSSDDELMTEPGGVISESAGNNRENFTGDIVISRIIITGGFSHNDFFTRLLATFLPQIEIYTAVISNASALGASLVMGKNRKDRSLKQKLLGLKRHLPFENLNLKEYS